MAHMIKDQEELGIYLMECSYVEEEACELAQEAEIDFPISKSEVDDYLVDCGILPYQEKGVQR